MKATEAREMATHLDPPAFDMVIYNAYRAIEIAAQNKMRRIVFNIDCSLDRSVANKLLASLAENKYYVKYEMIDENMEIEVIW